MSGRLQYASQGSTDYVAAALDNAPAWARAAINRARQARGLPPVLPQREYAVVEAAAAAARAAAEAEALSRVGVWVNGPGGKLVPVNSTTVTPRPRTSPRPTSSGRTIPKSGPRNGGRGPLVPVRVLIVPCGGLAKASAIRGDMDERVSPVAFGSADELNGRGEFDLRSGHHGPKLAVAGSRLRFVDGGSIGPVLLWEPDLALSWNGSAVRAIEAGADEASVGMTILERRVMDVPHRHRLVCRARLEHVALLAACGHRAAYGGAVATAFRWSWANDPVELKAQIQRAVDRSRCRANRA